MRHNEINYYKNVHWLKTLKKEHELSAVDLQPSTDKNGTRNDKIYARKGEIKMIRGQSKVKMCK